MPKLTVHEIRKLKGKRQLTEVFTADAREAAAANEAGIDMIVTSTAAAKEVRKAAPDVFLVIAPGGRLSVSNENALNIAYDCMEMGADAIYVGCHSMERIKAMADARIPVIGHVGFVPYRKNWIGGPRAIGKTSDEARDVWAHVQAYERAGAIGIELEVVPHQVAREISRRTSLLVISMGSGNGCDAQYLFSEDILGTNPGHVPRHAKQYVDLKPELARLHGLMRDAYKAFHAETLGGGYPEARHQVTAKEDQIAEFLAEIREQPLWNGKIRGVGLS